MIFRNIWRYIYNLKYNFNRTLNFALFSELNEQLEKQRIELGEQLKKKVDVFEMYNRKMEKLQEDFLLQTTKNA